MLIPKRVTEAFISKKPHEEVLSDREKEFQARSDKFKTKAERERKKEEKVRLEKRAKLEEHYKWLRETPEGRVQQRINEVDKRIGEINSKEKLTPNETELKHSLISVQKLRSDGYVQGYNVSPDVQNLEKLRPRNSGTHSA